MAGALNSPLTADNSGNYRDENMSIKSFNNQSIISSTAATTKSTPNPSNARQLMSQLVKRILVTTRVSPAEWPMKESLLLSMSESILSR